MRRLLISLLICLLPFQAWAGFFMAAGPHGVSTVTSEIEAAQLPCHGAAVQLDSQVSPQASRSDGVDTGHHGPACQDAQTCTQNCDLCHLSLSLPVWVVIAESVRPCFLPSAYALWRPGRHWPPPLEPPRL